MRFSAFYKLDLAGEQTHLVSSETRPPLLVRAWEGALGSVVHFTQAEGLEPSDWLSRFNSWLLTLYPDSIRWCRTGTC